MADVVVTWTEPASVTPVDHFVVNWATNANAPVPTTHASTATSASFVADNPTIALKPGDLVSAKVSAVGSAGGASAATQATNNPETIPPPPPPPAPAAPTNVTLTVTA